MELFSFDHLGRHFVLVLDLELQLERLLLDRALVSVKPMGGLDGQHVFEDSQFGSGNLRFKIDPSTSTVTYQLQQYEVEVASAQVSLSDEVKSLIHIDSAQGERVANPPVQSKSWIVLGSIGMKLLKSMKVIKVALVAASVAVYSVMFTVEFALALVAVLMVHEYGHVRAMKKFGIPTKGFYLIPFMGGVALGEQAKTQWEELYIAMMGPVYGLAMSAVFYAIFAVTGSHFCGLVASISAFLNLVNLFPVYPLDGGRVVKALVFSRRHRLAFIALLIVSAVSLYASYAVGLVFLSFFIVVGVLDIIASWSVPINADKTPLTHYGIWFSLIWYLGTALAFMALILLVAETHLPGSDIVTKILQS